jgi:hypothetical protein
VVSAFVDLKVLCTQCYDLARTRNALVPPSLEGLGELDDAQQQAFLRKCCVDGEAMQAEAFERHEIAEYSRWDYEGARFEFSDAERGRLTGRLCFVGSWSMEDGSWLWSWANPSIESDEKPHVHELRGFGEARGIRSLQQPRLDTDEEGAWHLTCVAAALLKPDMMYRVRSGHLWLHMVVFDLERAD